MLFFRDIKQLILIYRRGRSFSLKFEYHDPVIMASREEVDLGMGCDDPEAIIFALEGLY